MLKIQVFDSHQGIETEKIFKSTNLITIGSSVENDLVLVHHRSSDSSAIVDPKHGTLERTPVHGVWVYIDHSSTGTQYNEHNQSIHHAPILIQSGDMLHFGLQAKIQISILSPALNRNTRVMDNQDDRDDHPVPELLDDESTFPNLLRRVARGKKHQQRVTNPELPVLEYSSSPISTHHKTQLFRTRTVPEIDTTTPSSSCPSKVWNALPISHAHQSPSSLRIQVSKRRAQRNPTPTPSWTQKEKSGSPVRESTLLLDQLSLKHTLESKSREEEQLRKQQEEWFREQQQQQQQRHVMSSISSSVETIVTGRFHRSSFEMSSSSCSSSRSSLESSQNTTLQFLP